jgi:ketosteroid isomerase-like protein
MLPSPADTLRHFADAINSHNLLVIGALMTEDHTFVDPHGNEVSGKMMMLAGWGGYFSWFPDYKIQLEEVIEKGNHVYAYGTAEGTSAHNKKWKVPAAWRAIIEAGRVKHWQVYADTKLAFDALQVTP